MTKLEWIAVISNKLVPSANILYNNPSNFRSLLNYTFSTTHGNFRVFRASSPYQMQKLCSSTLLLYEKKSVKKILMFLKTITQFENSCIERSKETHILFSLSKILKAFDFFQK